MAKDSPDRIAARGAALTALLVGHFAAYPITFASVAATMSFAIIATAEDLGPLLTLHEPRTPTEAWLVTHASLTPSEAAVLLGVLPPLLPVAVVVFAVSHVTVLPWAVRAYRAGLERTGEEDRRRAAREASRWWVLSVASTAGVLVGLGALGWLWLFVR
ncbi:MAG: hypothetical protein AAGA56_30125 [Myxococcota bacterium]